MNQSNALQGYQEMQELGQQAQVMQQQLEVIDQQVAELNSVKEGLESVKNCEGTEEVLMTMGAGVYVKAKMQGNEKVIMNVGAGVVVEKDLDDALKLVTEQTEQMANIKENLTAEIASIQMNLQQLQMQMQQK